MARSFPRAASRNPVDSINRKSVENGMLVDSVPTISDLIEAFGGVSAFARIIGKGQSTAGEMKRSGSIGVRYWPMIIAAARERGEELDWVTSEVLLQMHTSNTKPLARVGATR